MTRPFGTLLWQTHFQGIEVWIKINDAVSDNIIGGDVAVHELNFQASSELFIVAVDKELAVVFEFGVGASFFDDLAFVGLIGELEGDVGVHGWKGTCLVLDLGFQEGQLEDAEDCVSFYGLEDLGVGGAATHY